MPNKDLISLQLEILGIDDAIEVLQTYREGLQERYQHMNGSAPAAAPAVRLLGRPRKVAAPAEPAKARRMAVAKKRKAKSAPNKVMTAGSSAG